MTISPSASGSSTVGERLTLALRQSGLLAVALFVAAQVADRLRPEETLDRGIVTTPFLWAIVVWLCTLLFHAVAFDRSQMRQLERWPLRGALGLGALTLVIGIATLNGGTVGRRVLYLVANSLGVVLFWWALLGLGYLLVRTVSPER